ncbi:hypothetical protein Tco_0399860 [Tanacetum coccineum]
MDLYLVKEDTMAWLPKFAELQERIGSGEWVDMMTLYCRRAAAEDREFVTRISMLRMEMINAREERVDFVQEELESVPGMIATVKTTEFLHETWEKMMGGCYSCRT